MDLSRMTIEQKIGQRLVVGFEGTKISEELRSLVKDWHVGNFILFAHNVHNNAQLKRLCDDLQQLVLSETGYPAFITIDQEGGVVSRLSNDAAVVPSAMGIAASGNPENAYTAGLITGRELNALGVNFDLAPVMDVNSNADNPVIGVRSYGSEPGIPAEYGVQMIRGLRDGGVYACAKHFPGHGDTAMDSHLSLPTVNKTMEELECCELIPFRAAIEAGVPAIMTTHILFPKLETDGVPATMSRRIITGLLREKMGYQGLVVSDCMMMDAIKVYYGTVNGIVAAAKAGVDMMITSHSIALARQGCEALRAEIEKEELSMT